MSLKIVSPDMNYYVDHMERMGHIRQLLSYQLRGDLLDIGCWEGGLRKLLPPEVTYHGIDYKLPAEKFNNFLKFELNSGNLPYEKNYFDCIVCSEVIEHIVDIEKFFHDLQRILKSGGILVMSVANNGTIGERVSYFLHGPIKWIEYGHFHAFTPDISRQLISKYFKIIKEKGYSPLLRGILPYWFKNIFISKKILQMLAEIFPKQFAGNYFFLCVKK